MAKHNRKSFRFIGTTRGSQIPSTANGSKDNIKEAQNKRTMQRRLLTLGLVAISLRSSLYAEDPIRYDPVSQQVIESRLQKYVGNDKQREDTLRQMFSQAGCDDQHLSQQPVKAVGAIEPDLRSAG
jgi:hypothetical protein